MREVDPTRAVVAGAGQVVEPSGGPDADGRAPVHTIAAFDFDGTITRRDTLGGFLAFVAGRGTLAAAMARRGLSMARSLRNDELRDATKSELLGAVLAGRSHVDLLAAGKAYAERLSDTFRPDTIERIEWHRGQGHTTTLVSASLRYYLDPVAEALGVDHVIGVEMELNRVIGVETELDQDARLTGRLVGPNVRGPEKARLLNGWIDETVRPGTRQAPTIWAYGNSSGDDELLALADHPVWVGRRARRNEPPG